MGFCRLCLTEKEHFSRIFDDASVLNEKPPTSWLVNKWFGILEIYENDVVSTLICNVCRSYMSEFNEYYDRILQLQSVYFNNPTFLKHQPLQELHRQDSIEHKLVDDDGVVDESKDEVVNNHPSTDSLTEDRPYTPQHVECKLELESDVEDDGWITMPENLDDESVAKRMKEKRIKKKLKKIQNLDDSKKRGAAVNSSSTKKEFARSLSTKKEAPACSSTTKKTAATPQRSPSKPPATKSPSSSKQVATKTNKNLLNLEMNKFFSMACELCSVSNFETFADAKEHYAEAHNQKGYLRCCCDRVFSERPRVIEHLKFHLNPHDFKCDRCPEQRIFRTKTSLKRHLNLMHNDVGDDDGERKYQCDMCPSKFSKPHKLDGHKFRNHSSDEIKRFICDICDKRFPAKNIITEHIKSAHTPRDRHICDFCGKEFRKEYTLNIHRNASHMGLPVIRELCNICGISIRKENMRKHVRLHFDPAVKCDICGKMISRKAMSKHKRSQHGNEQFDCKICGKSFSREIALKEHMAQHTGLDLYKCPYCPMTFKSSGNMHAHRKKSHYLEWERDRGKKMMTDDAELDGDESSTDESEADDAQQNYMSVKRKNPDFVYSTDSDSDELQDLSTDYDTPPPPKYLLMESNGISSPIPTNSSSPTPAAISSTPKAAPQTDIFEVTCVKQDDLSHLVKAVLDLTEIVKGKEELLKENTRQLNVLTTELRKLKDALRNENSPQTLTFQCKESLPLKSYPDLLSFEDAFDQEDFKGFLMTIGGKTVQKMMSNLVSVIYSIDLQTTMTWKGIRSPNGGWTKPPLCSTKTPHIIAEVCLAFFPRQTLADVTALFQSHMMHAMDRQRKKLKAQELQQKENAD